MHAHPESNGGAVLFVNDVARVAAFYEGVLHLTRTHVEPGLVVLTQGSAELVLHALPDHVVQAWPVATPPALREDGYSKLWWVVPSLEAIRPRVESLGGGMRPAHETWEWRGYRACDGHDPEGNVIQFRERLPATDT